MPYCDKRAYITVSADVLADILPVLAAAGLRVKGDLRGCVTLTIEGEALPDECVGFDVKEANILFAVDEKDGIRTPRVSSIKVVERPVVRFGSAA